MDNPEKLVTQNTRRRQKTKNKKQKNNPTQLCVGHHCAQTKTNNVNKTCEPSYKQLEVEKDRTLILCGNRNGYHYTELNPFFIGVIVA